MCHFHPFPAGPRVPGIPPEGPAAQQFERRSPQICAGIAQGSDCSTEGDGGDGEWWRSMGYWGDLRSKWMPTCSRMLDILNEYADTI